jgi:predicted amidohydrolase YtcJ
MTCSLRAFALSVGLGTALALSGPALAGTTGPADVVLTHARITTEDAAHPTAEALAVTAGKLVYVGDAAGVRAFIGPRTRIEDAGGRRVLPGLVDAHIHPAGIAELPGCSLDSRAVSLAELPPFIRACIQRLDIKPGQWVGVEQWNFTAGNAPSPSLPTLRAALDLASPDHPIALLGNDGHHGAFNSRALALARTEQGVVVGYSRASLAKDFAAFRTLIGVDATGEPNGTANEEARDAMGAPDLLLTGLPELMKAPALVPQRLNSLGITAVQDAFVVPETLPYYDLLRDRGLLSFRVNLMQLYNPEAFRNPAGAIDYGAVIARADAVRRRYAGDDLIRAEAVKIFADGVLEGNPYANPPTLPDSPGLKPYLQPIFGPGADGKLEVKGYVDTASPLCQAVRAHPEAYGDGKGVTAFTAANGYHPAQCAISSGKLQHERQVILDYARAAHLAGFTLHIHAIGDAAVRTAVDAIEGARAADGITSHPDGMAHLQVIAPEDVARIGRDHLFLAYTYSWANADPDYDLSVVPFFEPMSGRSHQAFHNPDSYYEKQFYPVRQTKAAGAILAAGSDAPVNTRDPQPFVNMQFAVTRALPGLPPANPAERLTLAEIVEAYTLNGARAMGRGEEFGSLTVGKSADFIVLDRDIFALADAGRTEEIGTTQVLQTWFRGRRVYLAAQP